LKIPILTIRAIIKKFQITKDVTNLPGREQCVYIAQMGRWLDLPLGQQSKTNIKIIVLT